MNILAKELEKRYETVEPMDFYREIFPEGELDSWGANTKGKYTGVAVEITDEVYKNGTPVIKRYTVTDELDEIDGLLHSNNFCVLAPISYIGKSRKSENARIMYALVVELDNLIVLKNGEQDGLERLITQWTDRVHWIPQPTFTVASGTGLHLYYQFEQGIPLFPNVVKELMKYKRELTEKIWNRHVTTDTGDKIQQESVFQAFRMVGTVTKKKDRVVAFRTGEPVTLEYMNRYVSEQNRVTQIYKSKLTKAQAKEKYPDWYEKRVVKQEPKGRWTCKKDLYEWWKRKIEAEAVVGHRYYCMMMLAIYAVKCNVSREELEQDCFELMSLFESRTDKDTNHFTEKDVLDALQSFEDKGLVTYPVNSISNRAGIPIEKNKRNGRKQEQHLQLARGIRSLKMQMGEPVTGGGRPTKEQIIREFMQSHPKATKSDIQQKTGISYPTIRKYYEKVRCELNGNDNQGDC